jgi:hypothetical protein
MFNSMMKYLFASEMFVEDSMGNLLFPIYRSVSHR